MAKYPTHLVLGRANVCLLFLSGGANVRPLFFREGQMSAPLFSGRDKCLTPRFREGKCPGEMSGGKCPTLGDREWPTDQWT